MATPVRPVDHTVLEHPGAAGFLTAAMAAAGGRLRSWSVAQLAVQPHRGATAAYRVEVDWPDRPATVEHVSAAVGRIPDGALILDDGVDRVGVWRHPFDPALPGLTAACDAARMGELLAGFGIRGPVTLRTLAYRPGRRAVVEARGADGRAFVKVVRPRLVEDLHHRHVQAVAAGVPAPRSLGWTADGLLVLAPIAGTSLTAEIDGGAPVPPPSELIELLDLLPDPLERPAARRTWLDRAPHYAAVVAAAVPPVGARAEAVARALTDEAGTGPTVTVHGDLYDSQLLVTSGRYTGLLDLDTAGPGDRLDDLACLLGHLAVTSEDGSGHAARRRIVLQAHLAAFDRLVPPDDLRYRVAAVVLALATGPHRVHAPGWTDATADRIASAERWLAAAREETLTSGSRRPQPWARS